MANMSYCRFHNTKIDLEDCLDTLREGEELSKEEYRAMKQMFKNFFDFLYDEGIIDNDAETEESLKEFFESVNVEK